MKNMSCPTSACKCSSRGKAYWDKCSLVRKKKILAKHPELLGLQGGNFFKSLFKKVIKPVGKVLLNEGRKIASNVAQKYIEKKVLGKGKAKARKPAAKKRVLRAGSLRLAGLGQRRLQVQPTIYL